MSTNLGKVRLKAVRVRVAIDHQTRVADIHDVQVTSPNVVPGATVPVRIKIKRRYGRGSYVKVVPVTIPRTVPDGALVRIEVAAGLLATVDVAPPESLADVRRIVSKLYHARQLDPRGRTRRGTQYHHAQGVLPAATRDRGHRGRRSTDPDRVHDPAE